MKIVYDYSIFFKQKYGGISRYFVNLINNFPENENIDPIIISPIHKNIFLKNIKQQNKKGFYFNNKIPFTGKIINSINKLISSFYLKSLNPSIVHHTYYNHSCLRSSCINVITVYDLYHEIFHVNKNFRPKRNAINNADHIMCISENTKKDLINLYDVQSSKITVSPLGHEHANFDFKKNIHNKPYLLYVGSREKYKNYDIFIESIARSKSLINDFNIVFFGGGKFTKEEEKKIEDLKIPLKIIKNIQGKDEDLYKLYLNASAFIFPSKHEGFGLPILEAMKAKVPIICSDIPVFKEVAGNGAEYFDVNSHESLSDSISRVVYSDTKKKELISNSA
jgi:glycosyltransferase involved in cell wall biosynthesis